jgi:chromosome segregation ATPase
LEAERRRWERERTTLAAALHDLGRTLPLSTGSDAARHVARSVPLGLPVDQDTSPQSMIEAIIAIIRDNQAALADRIAEWERREAELQAALADATEKLDQTQRERDELATCLAAERASVAQWQRQVQELNDRVAALAAAAEHDRGEQQAQRQAAVQTLAVQAEEEWAQRQAALEARERQLEQQEQEFIKSHQQLEQARLVFEREMLIHGSQVKVLAKLGQLEAEKSWWYRIWHPFDRLTGD